MRPLVSWRRNSPWRASAWSSSNKAFKAIEYGRQVGGGTVHFTANYWRFHESDFHECSLYGAISGTSFDDWPIRYVDLEPYYTKAEEELGISGLDDGSGRGLSRTDVEIESTPICHSLPVYRYLKPLRVTKRKLTNKPHSKARPQ